MISFSGMVMCIFANAPSKSKFESTLLVLGGFLGRSMFIGGGLVCEITSPVERGWFIHFFLVYTWNCCFFDFSLDSWSRLFITSILAFLVASFMPSWCSSSVTLSKYWGLSMVWLTILTWSCSPLFRGHSCSQCESLHWKHQGFSSTMFVGDKY